MFELFNCHIGNLLVLTSANQVKVMEIFGPETGVTHKNQ